MFMFWSKRAVLTRRLLKAKVRGEHETECEVEEDKFSHINIPNSNIESTTGFLYDSQVTTTIQDSSTCDNHRRSSAIPPNRTASVVNRFHQGCCGGDFSHDEDDDYEEQQRRHRHNQYQQHRIVPNRLTRCKQLLKSLKENQLEMLLNVVENYGTDFGSCILVPRRNTSPSCLLTTKQQSPATSSGFSLPQKQQSESMIQCNRHQRCGLASSLHENPSRRIPHRHFLRSHRNHGGSRCTRCVNCHGHCEDQRGAVRDGFVCTNDEDFIKETRSNEMNLRVIDITNSSSCRNSIALQDLRQEQPAWSPGGDTSVTNPSTISGGKQIGETGASRPSRDRCRNNYCKTEWTSTMTTTRTRKRRDSPLSNEILNSSDLSLDGPPDDPHLLSCQIWRWPDLANSSELKKLPVCHSTKDPVYVCCNPYHWSRLCKPESPPPPYCLMSDRLRPEDRAPSENSGNYRRCVTSTSPELYSGSLTTNGEDGGEIAQKEWCTLAYWELGGRVGRLYPVEPATVNVFDSLHGGDGLCLATLGENRMTSPAVQRTRSKIGLGLMLSQESDGVWAYNRSDSPIFVNSPTLDDPESRTLLVYRVPPGFCLNIFDRSKTLQLPRSLSQTSPASGSFNSGPVDANSVRISFAKGWGPKYSRQEVTSCPCWLEVLLAPCR